MVVQETKLFGASKVAKTLLSHNNMLITANSQGGFGCTNWKIG